MQEIDTIPDGSEITIELSNNPVLLSQEEWQDRLNAIIDKWKDDAELIKIFTEIDEERHVYRGREIATFDD